MGRRRGTHRSGLRAADEHEQETCVDWVIDAVATGGVVALMLVMLAENLFPPIPSEAVLPLAGYLVGRGDLDFASALLASTLGSVVGALILYAIGRYGGRAVLLRYG